MDTKFNPPSHRGKVGDLIKHRTYGKCLIINVNIGFFNTYDLITTEGYQFQMTAPNEYVNNTGMEYTYLGWEQAAKDFDAGLFTPFFN